MIKKLEANFYIIYKETKFNEDEAVQKILKLY